MIEIIVNHVQGRTGKRTRIGRGVIENDGAGGAHFGNYDFIYGTPGKGDQRKVKIQGFMRQKRNAWDLIYVALRQARSNRNR